MLGQHQYIGFLCCLYEILVLATNNNDAKDQKPPVVSNNAKADSTMESLSVVGDEGTYDTITARIGVVVHRSPAYPVGLVAFASVHVAFRIHPVHFLDTWVRPPRR